MRSSAAVALTTREFGRLPAHMPGLHRPVARSGKSVAAAAIYHASASAVAGHGDQSLHDQQPRHAGVQ